MKLLTLHDRHEESFSEAVEDINWREVAKALDEGDSLLAARLLRDPLEAMADSKEDDDRNWESHYRKVNQG